MSTFIILLYFTDIEFVYFDVVTYTKHTICDGFKTFEDSNIDTAYVFCVHKDKDNMFDYTKLSDMMYSKYAIKDEDSEVVCWRLHYYRRDNKDGVCVFYPLLGLYFFGTVFFYLF